MVPTGQSDDDARGDRPEREERLLIQKTYRSEAS
jgi:hypothetical protein